MQDQQILISDGCFLLDGLHLQGLAKLQQSGKKL